MDQLTNDGQWAIEDEEVLRRLWCAGAFIGQIRKSFPDRTRQQIANKIKRLSLGRRARFDRITPLAREIAAGRLEIPYAATRWSEADWLDLVGQIQSFANSGSDEIYPVPRTPEKRHGSTRLGQTDFRRDVLANYSGRCCVSGCLEIATIEAAHIVPFAEGGEHELSNSLALRSDLHRLFDAGLIAIDPLRLFVQVSPTLKCPSYRALDHLPADARSTRVPPCRKALAWHQAHIFKN